ncbi:TetR/AcrR family transcriptional regulator [Neobacillus mesonae]|nr:TetR/AcrR family transcriptional regulator [Neobacillus mesonae]
MSNSTTDKKKHILITALQLFSTKGPAATSMQEIAELCGISKGTLYLHYKSKEELQESVVNYCIQTIYDQIAVVEREREMPPRDKLRRQIEILLENFLELREFFIAQLLDMANRGEKGFPLEKWPEGMLAHAMKLFSQKMVDIYGPEVLPYSVDLALQLHSMMGSYLKLIVTELLSIHLHRMAEYLVETLDILAEAKMRENREPFIPKDVWLPWVEENIHKHDSKKHPLYLIKEIRHTVRSSEEMQERMREDVLESLSILEDEFFELKPRRAIITGMLANLEQVPHGQELLLELREVFEMYLKWRD